MLDRTGLCGEMLVGRALRPARQPRWIVPVLLSRGAVQAIVFPQRSAFILRAEASAALEDGDHFIGKHVQHLRQQQGHDIEPVRGAVIDPIFDRVCDLFRGAGNDEMPAGAREFSEKLAHGQAFPFNRTNDQFRSPARGLALGRVGEIRRRQDPVERQVEKS